MRLRRECKIFYLIFKCTLNAIKRDRLLHALAGVSLLLFFLVPIISMFSMRQVQELAITLFLSSLSITLLVFSILLGVFSIWKDIEKRYIVSVLALPVKRSDYLLGKFCAVSLFLLLTVCCMGIIGYALITFASKQYPSAISISWFNISTAVLMSGLKYILLAAVAVLFSVISTSIFLPIAGTIAIFFAGSATQGLYEYINSGNGLQDIPMAGQYIIKVLYYVLPNFSAFDYQVYAVYALPISFNMILYTACYWLIYTSFLLFCSSIIFSRKEFP